MSKRNIVLLILVLVSFACGNPPKEEVAVGAVVGTGAVIEGVKNALANNPGSMIFQHPTESRYLIVWPQGERYIVWATEEMTDLFDANGKSMTLNQLVRKIRNENWGSIPVEYLPTSLFNKLANAVSGTLWTPMLYYPCKECLPEIQNPEDL